MSVYVFYSFFNADEWKEAVNIKHSWPLLSLVQLHWLLWNVARDEFGLLLAEYLV